MTRTFSHPPELAPFISEAAQDHGGLSAFIQSAVISYVDAKTRVGRRPNDDELQVELLRANLEAKRRQNQVNTSDIHRLERRLEEIHEDLEERRASGTVTLKFETPDELVTAFARTIPRESEANWRNLARAHGFKDRDVLTIVQRIPSQAQLPRGRPK